MYERPCLLYEPSGGAVLGTKNHGFVARTDYYMYFCGR